MIKKMEVISDVEPEGFPWSHHTTLGHYVNTIIPYIG